MIHERMPRSYFVDRNTAERAVDMAMPILQNAVDNIAINQSGVLYVVIADPCLTPLNATFEQAVLYERAIGRDPKKWDADYAGFARAKASLSWRTGLDSCVVQHLEPHKLQSGDTTLWGSVVIDGIVVGVSGGDPVFDEALAGIVAMFLRALAKIGVKEKAKELYLQ